jgi:misacylated tRNA(Ala) deacylase
MTELLYQLDSYLQSFEASIIEVDLEKRAIALDKSAFYPGGGGQPADSGLLTCLGRVFNVKRAKKVGENVFHYLEGEDPLPEVGAGVQGSIDWERRYRLMRTHTALHVLCGVVFRDYGASVTGGDMDPLEGRMDFEFETMHRDLVEEIQKNVNDEIAKAHPVRVSILPRDEAFKIPDLIRTKINLLPEGIQQVRVVEIVGLDLQADGGTHVANTSEVGHVRVVDYKSKGKINKRVYIAVED